MLKYLLDTHILIYVIKNRPASVRERLLERLPAIGAWRDHAAAQERVTGCGVHLAANSQLLLESVQRQVGGSPVDDSLIFPRGVVLNG